MPVKPCRKAGCGEFAKKGGAYCPAHTIERDDAASRRVAERGTAAQRGYGTVWQRIRERVLRDEPMCRRCGRVATLVHHRDRNAFNNDPMNHEPLCKPCHDAEHKDEMWRGRRK